MDMKKKKRVLEGIVKIHAEKDEHGMGFVCRIGSSMCVVTAAHCLPRLVDPRFASGDPVIVEMSKLDDDSVRAKALIRFVDPCADVAILSDSNWGCDLIDLPNAELLQADFETLCGRRRKLKISSEMPDVNKPFSVSIFTVDGEWVTGTASLRNRYCPQFGFTGEGNIRPGTSGAPVFNSSGKVIGIVTSVLSQENDEQRCVVLLASALPRWAIIELDEDGRGDLQGLSEEVRDEIAQSQPIDHAVKIRELMQQSGATIEQIAENLGTDVEVLRLLLDDDD